MTELEFHTYLTIWQPRPHSSKLTPSVKFEIGIYPLVPISAPTLRPGADDKVCISISCPWNKSMDRVLLTLMRNTQPYVHWHSTIDIKVEDIRCWTKYLLVHLYLLRPEKSPSHVHSTCYILPELWTHSVSIPYDVPSILYSYAIRRMNGVTSGPPKESESWRINPTVTLRSLREREKAQFAIPAKVHQPDSKHHGRIYPQLSARIIL